MSRIVIASYPYDASINAELNNLAAAYVGYGHHVVRVEVFTPDSVFLRDVVAPVQMNGGNAVIRCQMGKRSREWEPRHLHKAMKFAPTLGFTDGATFEGADLLWITNDFALIGIGDRTNEAGAEQVRDYLDDEGVSVQFVHLPDDHNQHLLGLVNSIRGQLFSSVVLGELENYDVTPLPNEYKAANFVFLDGVIYMTKHCPETYNVLREYANTIVCVETEQLHKHGGSVGCATCIY